MGRHEAGRETRDLQGVAHLQRQEAGLRGALAEFDQIDPTAVAG